MLAGVALAVNWLGAMPFSVMVGLVTLVMCWEWCRIVRHADFDTRARSGMSPWSVAQSSWPLSERRGRLWSCSGSAPSLVGLLARGAGAGLASGVGVLYVGLPAIALIWLRASDQHGLVAILFVFAVVWTTDTFAYVCGTLIGGAKLWPTLSPNKTWAGTLGGIVFAGIAGALFALALVKGQPVELAITGVALSVAAQAGDMAESALKRVYGVRHSSGLIPGHGGFMDRMDGIAGAAIAAAVLALAVNAVEPARALLYWM